MASVVRVKRRRNEDPVEALILSQKRSRVESDEKTDLNTDSVLEFAGTLFSKDEPVSTCIKKVIKTKKIHKELHPHTTESWTKADLMTKVRAQNAQTSQNNRYHITSRRRALHIDTLDVNSSEGKNEESPSLNSESDSGTENVDRKNESCEKAISQTTETQVPDGSKDKTSEKSSECIPVKQNEAESSKKEEKISCETKDNVVCLIDVEHHQEESAQASASGITVNNVPMVSSKVAVPIEEESDDYVYDIYYTHTQIKDVEAVLTIEAMCNELMVYERESSDEEVGDLDEDSNDEGNWRNDYPDEDPGFYVNEGQDYDYEDDLNFERNFVSGYDEGDILADWMDTRCRIEVDCDDFVNDDADDDKSDGSLSDEYREDDGLYY